MKLQLPVISILLSMILPGAQAAEGDDERSAGCADIRGVWKIESMDVGIGDNARTTVPKAIMFFFANNHYSAIRDFAEPKSHEASAPADRQFMADAGTYEFDGEDLVVHHMVAGFPVLGSMTFGCELTDRDTLVLTPQYDKMVLPGLDLRPTKDGKMGYGDVATRYVFKRLE